ncbi:MAG: hypothetical protein AAGA54_27465 [Myxococcota bacterium]
MADGTKKGALGVAAIAGLFGLRAADDCARLGARGARAMGDDVVSVGVRTGDAVLGPGVHLGDEAAEAAARISWGPAKAGATPKTFVGDDGLVEALVEGGVEVTLELIQWDAPEGSAVSAAPTQVRCPSVSDLTAEPDAWSAYLDGLGIACTPKPFISRARRDTFEVDGAYEPIASVMRACAEAGGTCMLIGCDAAAPGCAEDVRRAMLGHLRPEYAPYVREVAGRAMAEAGPAWVAYVAGPGVVTVLRQGDAAASPAPP